MDQQINEIDKVLSTSEDAREKLQEDIEYLRAQRDALLGALRALNSPVQLANAPGMPQPSAGRPL